ncbi:MAG: DinB family protein [Acidimicrobiales bacterium]
MVEPLQDPRRHDPPPVTDDERASYEAWLDWHRITLLMKCEGLDDAGRRARPVSTSLLSLHGLVRHMAEVERSWFRKVISGEDLVGGIYWDDHHPEGDFEVPDGDAFEDDVAVWVGEIAQARTIAAAHGLDDTGIRPRTGQAVDLRWVYLHMIEEYARHNGHADLLRELVDGAVGD